MTRATQLLAGFCPCLCAAPQSDGPAIIACDLTGIRSADRPRYNELFKRLRTAIRYRTEVSNGYGFRLDSTTISLPEAAEWMNMERLCCPFLTFQLSTSGNQQFWLLTITGPEGTKKLLDAEFGAPSKM
jgi:hypothetical protein